MDEKLPPPNVPESTPPVPGPPNQEQALHSRRTFLMNIGIALNAAVAAAIATPVVVYLLGPVLRRKEYRAWIDLGNASDFPTGETKLVTFKNPFTDPWDGATANIPAYVRCSEPGKFTVFAINCAHLGCPVRWFAESQLFMCPCHGGVYYADGSRASGPPERGLFTYELKLENGKLMIKAGQTPTLSNRAANNPCPSATAPISPGLVSRIAPCPPIKGPGTNASTVG
jgi:menaquinol-cytochrome c reductase iron-sulfur subunit